jgi:hypothetical protein
MLVTCTDYLLNCGSTRGFISRPTIRVNSATWTRRQTLRERPGLTAME